MGEDGGDGGGRRGRVGGRPGMVRVMSHEATMNRSDSIIFYLY